MYFLIINDIVNIKEKKITHYSLDKGLNFGIGLVNNGCNVDFIINDTTFIENNIKFINYADLSEETINLYDYIIIVREGLIEDLLNKFTELKKVFFNKNKKPKIIIKSDSCIWLLNKNFRKYISSELSINASLTSIIKWANSQIDIICVQNNDFFKQGIKNGINKNNMIITNMSVPDEIIDFDSLENPFDNNYSYCVDSVSMMSSGKAFKPLYYINNPDKINELVNKKRIKIIYMGRIKTDGGKIIYLMKEIMEKLGDDYELHIFPGSFILFDEKTQKYINYSANNSNHLKILRDTIFPDALNVFIHCPFDHKDIKKYLWHSDIGIDFSSSRPLNVRADAGNAKLLEYCYMGLPVVTEKNVNNSYLVENCSNGIILNGIATTQEYIDSIIKLSNLDIDRKKASQITIKNENWTLRTKNFINDLKKLHE
jgi:hypothetical protein